MYAYAASWLPRFASLAAIAILAAVCAQWFWVFFAPQEPALPHRPEASLERPLDAIARARPFGTGPAAQPAAPAPTTDLLLRGISSTRKGGMAVIAIDKGRTVAVSAGDEILPGVRLEKVQPDHVLVSRNGVQQRLELPRRKPVDAAPVAATPAAAGKR